MVWFCLNSVPELWSIAPCVPNAQATSVLKWNETQTTPLCGAHQSRSRWSDQHGTGVTFEPWWRKSPVGGGQLELCRRTNIFVGKKWLSANSMTKKPESTLYIEISEFFRQMRTEWHKNGLKKKTKQKKPFVMVTEKKVLQSAATMNWQTCLSH